MIEIAEIEICATGEKAVYRAATAADFGQIALFGDCVARSLDPFRIEVIGPDPQLHLPPLASEASGVVVRIHLQVQPTSCPGAVPSSLP
jgi:hypothetical protein